MIISTCDYNNKSYNILGVVDSIKTRVFGSVSYTHLRAHET